MDTSHTIVVGVNDSASAQAAIRYGAHLATLVDGQLVLAHVVPQAFRTGGLYAVAPDYFENAGRKLLSEAADLAARQLGSGRASTELLHGPAVRGLARAADRGRTIVVGSDARSRTKRLGIGSTVVGLSTHCAVPVLVVPAAWTSEADVPQVMVAIRDLPTAAGLLRTAFVAAQERHGHLFVVHVSGLPNVDEDPARPDRHADLPSLRLAEALDAQVAAVGTEYPDVAHETLFIHGPTAHVLTTRTESCDLLILQRRHHPAHNPHLGRTARALLTTSRCPVLIAPPTYDSGRRTEGTLPETTTSGSFGSCAGPSGDAPWEGAQETPGPLHGKEPWL